MIKRILLSSGAEMTQRILRIALTNEEERV